MSKHSLVDVGSDDAGMRLDRWFKKHYPGLPHALIQKLLRKGAIRVDGKKAKANQAIEAGQSISIPEIETNPTAPSKKYAGSFEDAQRYLLKNIVYQDDNVIAINKPPGLASQGGTKVFLSVDDMLDHLINEGQERPKLVHRIDKDTSGVMLIACNSQAARKLTQAFKSKDVEKTYWAIVVGVPRPASDSITLPLSAKKKVGKLEKATVDEVEGKDAVTHYHVIDHASDTLAWVALRPETGRMHQLRVHMAAIGHPILGDGKYGGKAAFIDGLNNQLHLHARRIRMNVMGMKLDVTAPITEHMRSTWQMFDFDTELATDPFDKD